MDDVSLDTLDTMEEVPIDGQDERDEQTVGISTTDVQNIVEEVVGGYYERLSDDVAASGGDNAEAIRGINDQVGGISETQDEILRIIADSSSVDNATVVLVDESQWEELQDCWSLVKGTMEIVTVLLALSLGVLAAIWGHGVFRQLAKGWHHG